jgi:hypothetical protein
MSLSDHQESEAKLDRSVRIDRKCFSFATFFPVMCYGYVGFDLFPRYRRFDTDHDTAPFLHATIDSECAATQITLKQFFPLF